MSIYALIIIEFMYIKLMRNVNEETTRYTLTKAARRDPVSFICAARLVLPMYLNHGSLKLCEVWYKRALEFSVLKKEGGKIHSRQMSAPGM